MESYARARTRVWEVLEVAKRGDTLSLTFDWIILGLISINAIAAIAGTVNSIEERFGSLLGSFEIVSVLVFAAEYVARLWSCTSDRRFESPIFGRLRYALTPLALLDLLAFLPTLLIGPTLDLRFIRVFRLIRLARLAKVGRYMDAVSMFRRVVAAKKEELVVTTALMGMLLIVGSSFMYLVETDAQPDKFPDIPSAMWWGVVTLTTVGYGDLYPITALGKLLGSVVAMLGISLFALPAGILASGFIEQVQRKEAKRCPHCGKELP